MSFLRRKKMISFGSAREEGEYSENLVIMLEGWR
jgi:hypothetical protein